MNWQMQLTCNLCLCSSPKLDTIFWSGKRGSRRHGHGRGQGNMNPAVGAAAAFSAHLLVERAVGIHTHHSADLGSWWPRPAAWTATGTIERLHLLLHWTCEHRAGQRRAFAGRAATSSAVRGGHLVLLGAVQRGALEQTLHADGLHCAQHTLLIDRAKARAAILCARSTTLATVSGTFRRHNVDCAISTHLTDSRSASIHNTFVPTVAGGSTSSASRAAIRSVRYFLLLHRAGDRGTVEGGTWFANRASITPVGV